MIHGETTKENKHDDDRRINFETICIFFTVNSPAEHNVALKRCNTEYTLCHREIFPSCQQKFSIGNGFGKWYHDKLFRVWEDRNKNGCHGIG